MLQEYTYITSIFLGNWKYEGPQYINEHRINPSHPNPSHYTADVLTFCSLCIQIVLAIQNQIRFLELYHNFVFTLASS